MLVWQIHKIQVQSCPESVFMIMITVISTIKDSLKVTVVSPIVCLHGKEGSVEICQFCFKWEGVYFYKSGFQCCHIYVSQKSHQV